jgi:hypothetical protein
MKTSEELLKELSLYRGRVSNLRSTLYLIAYGELHEDSARREAKRAMDLDDKMLEEK